MTERRVVVNGATQARSGDLEIRINGDDPTFQMFLGRSASRTLDWLDPRTRDLALVAGAVFAADSATPRGGASRPDFGARWSRDFHFVVPAEDIDFWSAAPVHDALVEALTFLTGDSFAFTFVKSPRRRLTSLLSEQPPLRRRGSDDEVVLFSGGLDSLAGALETLESGDGKVFLVSHRSAPKVSRIQHDLIQHLRMRYRGPVHWFPVQATLAGHEALETTQRSRSFLFAAIGYIAARQFGCNRLRFFENGIVSLNLPISRQIVGVMAARTTHPLALRRMAALLSLVAGHTIVIDNPYLWKTKTEIVRRLASHGGSDLAKWTISCSNVRERTRMHTHCGCCSQCLDRRFAMLAAGLDASDPAEMYETEAIVGRNDDEQDRMMALDWTRHARALRGLDARGFASRYGAELNNLLEAFPERPPWEVHADALAMHHRHGEAIEQVLTNATRDNAATVVSGRLQPGSLLRMLLADQLALPDPAPQAKSPVEDKGFVHEETPPILPLRVTLLNSDRPVAIVHGLGEIEGPPVRIVTTLRPLHDEDCSKGMDPEEHRHMLAGDIANALPVTKETVRQDVSRCRSRLADFYEAIEGVRPPRHLLIENKLARGYRLDPESRFFDALEA